MDLKYGMPKNLMQWAEDHKAQLSPPVCNAAVFPDGNYIINMVGGGNRRTDFHDNPTEELFYQLKGEVQLLVWDRGKFEEITLKAGDMFLQPPHLVHSPQRPENGLCLLVERPRPQGTEDGFVWYCARCATQVWRADRHVNSLTEDLPVVFKEFYALDEEQRRCPNCGTQHPGKDVNAWHRQLHESGALA